MTKSITRLMRQPRTHHSASGAKSHPHFFPSHLLNLNRERFVPYSGFRLHRDKIQKQKVIRSVAGVFVRNFNEPFMKAFVCLCEDINSLFFFGRNVKKCIKSFVTIRWFLRMMLLCNKCLDGDHIIYRKMKKKKDPEWGRCGHSSHSAQQHHRN